MNRVTRATGMDKSRLDLRQCMEQQGKVCKMFQEVYSRAYSGWKQLEEHLDLSYKSIESVCEQLVEREKEIASKEELCVAINASIREKRIELDRIESSISEGAQKLDCLEKGMQQKSEENREMMKKFEDVAELKERRLNEVQKRFEERSRELESKEEELRERQSRIDECDKEIKAREERLKLVENSIVERSVELGLKENQLDLIEKLKDKSLESLETLMDNHACEVGTKERKFESWVKEHELKVALVESRYKEVDLINKKVNEWLKEVELKEKNSVFLKGSVEEGFRELQEKEREFEKRVSEFEMKQRKFESSQKSVDDGVEIVTEVWDSEPYVVELEQMNSPSADPQSCPPKQGEEKDLLWLLNEHLKRYDLVRRQILVDLQAMSDPAMSVLCAMQRNNNFPLVGDDSEFDESCVRRSSILLSELLMKTSRNITPEVREEAMKLAINWRENMTLEIENCLEVLALLHFLVTYKLISEVNANELRGLLDVIGLNVEALQSNPSICTVDKEPESIEKLIRRGEIIHAVKHVCEMKLTDKFSPVQLLTDYLDDAENHTTLSCKANRSIEQKRKAVDKERAALVAAIECLKECNLEPEFLLERITRRISFLENRGSFSFMEVEQSKKRGKKSVSPQDRPKQGKSKRRGVVERDIVVEAMSSLRPVLPTTPAPPIVWKKPPQDIVKVNFGFWGQADCGIASAVARDHNGTPLAISYCKIPSADPLKGNALAAHGALKLGLSKEWRAIYLEGDSLDVIHYLQRNRVAPSHISSVVFDSVALLKSFGCAFPVWVDPKANIFAHSVCRWAAEKNLQNDLTWQLMPGSLVSLFEEASKV